MTSVLLTFWFDTEPKTTKWSSMKLPENVWSAWYCNNSNRRQKIVLAVVCWNEASHRKFTKMYHCWALDDLFIVRAFLVAKPCVTASMLCLIMTLTSFRYIAIHHFLFLKMCINVIQNIRELQLCICSFLSFILQWLSRSTNYGQEFVRRMI